MPIGGQGKSLPTLQKSAHNEQKRRSPDRHQIGKAALKDNLYFCY